MYGNPPDVIKLPRLLPDESNLMMVMSSLSPAATKTLLLLVSTSSDPITISDDK